MSVTEKDISDYIYISLRFYYSGFGCQNSSKTATLDQKLEFYDTMLIKPWKWMALTLSYNISKSQKRRYITLIWRDSPFIKCNVTIHGNSKNLMFMYMYIGLWVFTCDFSLHAVLNIVQLFLFLDNIQQCVSAYDGFYVSLSNRKISDGNFWVDILCGFLMWYIF